MANILYLAYMSNKMVAIVQRKRDTMVDVGEFLSGYG